MTKFVRSTELSGRSVRRATALALLLAAFATGQTAAHGDLHEQIDDVTREIARRPGDARLYLKRAELHRFHGESEAALADYDRAARLEVKLVVAGSAGDDMWFAYDTTGQPSEVRLP